MTDLCYMCAQTSTSREHVPPKCVFPEQKDTLGRDYRKGLITIPSCDLHNSQKSKDDEYLMMVLTSYFNNNQAAETQIKSKIARAWAKNPVFATTVVKNLRTVSLEGEEKHAYEVDTPRFNKSLEWAANGLHFHVTGTQANPPYKVISYPLFQLDGPEGNEVNLGRANILAMADQLFLGQPRTGENQEIFWHQVSPHVEGRGIVRMCFFESFQVVAMSSGSLEA